MRHRKSGWELAALGDEDVGLTAPWVPSVPLVWSIQQQNIVCVLADGAVGVEVVHPPIRTGRRNAGQRYTHDYNGRHLIVGGNDFQPAGKVRPSHSNEAPVKPRRFGAPPTRPLHS